MNKYGQNICNKCVIAQKEAGGGKFCLCTSCGQAQEIS